MTRVSMNLKRKLEVLFNFEAQDEMLAVGVQGDLPPTDRENGFQPGIALFDLSHVPGRLRQEAHDDRDLVRRTRYRSLPAIDIGKTYTESAAIIRDLNGIHLHGTYFCHATSSGRWPNGLRLSGEGGEADRVRCSRGFGDRVKSL